MKFSFKKIPFKKRYIVLAVVIILIIVARINNKRAEEASREYFDVVRGDVAETLELVGDIDIEDRADLGFGFSGRVARVNVVEGQEVVKGDVLASLSMNQLQAEYLEAQANLRQVQADRGATVVNVDFVEQNLQNIIEEQNILVENAYRALLNEDLQAYSLDEGDEAIAPTISGTYLGSQEGEYIMSVYSSGTNSGFSFNLSGLETGFAEVFTNNPGPLGEDGLFVMFDEDGRYSRTDWVVPIPNTRSANYTAKKNAYDQAVATRAKVIAEAEDSYQQTLARESGGSVSRSSAEVSAAESRLSAVRARMQDGVIVAPFDGVVGSLSLSEGEVVSANTSYVTLVGDEEFELVLYVPEIDVAKLSVGDNVSVSLDAYGDTVSWDAMITVIDVIDTIVDGVPVYETKASIINIDERIRVGMSARATIVTNQKNEVLRAPQYFFTRVADGYEVFVATERGLEKTIVQLGVTGSDGFVEIVSGLSLGDTIVYQPSSR